MDHWAIYNNGSVGSVFWGCHPEHEVIQHIADDAIEELFPPTAEEAAEMEAADDFVEQMAWLSYLDECDEAARSSFSGFGKRWAARRKVGLIKVHPPRQYNADDDSRGSGGRVRSVSVTETALVTYTPRIFEVKPRKLTSHSLGVPKNVKGMQHGHRGRYYSASPRTHY